MSRARLLSLLLLACALFTFAAPARAHEFLPCLLDVRELGGGRYAIAWKPATSRAEVSVRLAPPTPVFPPSCQRSDNPSPSDVTWILDCGPAGLAGLPIAVQGLTAGADAVLRFTAANGASTSAVLREDAPSLRLPSSADSAAPRFASHLALAQSYLGAGVEHILGGFDHLLFVLGLLLLVRRSEATLPPEQRRIGNEMARTVTAFTVAHSVTLALSVLGLVRLAPAPVEATIALSLFFLAVELSRPAAPSARGLARRAAFAFGLLHGFGFAGALRALGLPEGQVPLSLLSFNLGVELGQLAFVLLALALLHLARKPLSRAPAWLSRAPAYLLGSLAALWCFERVSAFWT
ncbi:MAG: HupE/UreJ family protein [Minicystis sp.]